MKQILDNEDRRGAMQLSVDDWVERARVAETKVVEYQNKYYAEKQKCQNTHERALRYLKEHGLLDIKFRRAEADKTKLVEALENICAWIDSDSCGGVGSVKRYEEARAVLKGAP